ncbi:hypothetical protein ACP70R_038188 [Stipagrostis hirtigluma subsp. patula]
MKHQPLSVHEGDAADDHQETASSRPRYIISAICEFALITWMIVTPCYYIFFDLPPEFSVHLAPIGRGLDMAAPAPSISPAFLVTLHASNRRAKERCYRHGEGVVTYAGFTIASGRVPDLCVPRKESREVPFLAWEDGVGFPEHLRDRMAAEHKVGAVELEVQVRLFQGGDFVAGRPTWMWCKVRMGGAQPPDMTPCTVFGLQNWFVDASLDDSED